MKIKGKRILKNGVTAGYVKQKDGSWRFRFLKGAGRKETKRQEESRKKSRKKIWTNPMFKGRNIKYEILYDMDEWKNVFLENFKNNGNGNLEFSEKKLSLIDLGSTSEVYGCGDIVIKRIDFNAIHHQDPHLSLEEKFVNEVNFLKKKYMEEDGPNFIPDIYLAWIDKKKNIGYMILSRYKSMSTIKNMNKKYKKKFLKDIISKLKYLNSLGYTHGDVQLGNIMWNNDDEQSMLIDFGQVGNTSPKNLKIQQEQIDALAEELGFVLNNNNNI